jgi:hypothetical protein
MLVIDNRPRHDVELLGSFTEGQRIACHYGKRLSSGGRRKNHHQGSIIILAGDGAFHHARCVGTTHPRFTYEVGAAFACAFEPIQSPMKFFVIDHPLGFDVCHKDNARAGSPEYVHCTIYCHGQAQVFMEDDRVWFDHEALLHLPDASHIDVKIVNAKGEERDAVLSLWTTVMTSMWDHKSQKLSASVRRLGLITFAHDHKSYLYACDLFDKRALSF